MKKRIFGIIFTVSVFSNITFSLSWLISELNAPTGKLGRLKEEVPLSVFMQDSGVYLTLPKGLVVRDSSPNFISGIGQFEPLRFEIEVTTDRDIVDWGGHTEEKLFGAYYSADTYFDFQAGKYVLENP